LLIYDFLFSFQNKLQFAAVFKSILFSIFVWLSLAGDLNYLFFNLN